MGGLGIELVGEGKKRVMGQKKGNLNAGVAGWEKRKREGSLPNCLPGGPFLLEAIQDKIA